MCCPRPQQLAGPTSPLPQRACPFVGSLSARRFLPEGKPGSFCTARFPHSPFICQSMQDGPDRARLRMRRLCSVVCGPACPRDTLLVKISLEQLSHVICGHSCQIKHPEHRRVKSCMQLSIWMQLLALCHSKARRGLDAEIPWNETRVFHDHNYS